MFSPSSYPKSIKKFKEVLDTTLAWRVPQGYMDYYIILYKAIDEPHNQKAPQVKNLVLLLSVLEPRNQSIFQMDQMSLPHFCFPLIKGHLSAQVKCFVTGITMKQNCELETNGLGPPLFGIRVSIIGIRWWKSLSRCTE
ncbi:hypothetical protein CDAR_385871 [Caerostris darwini]|uniref:Uncharacterized protein n=1 Tax=Caerostris darwini TaxID=1538125 RepID=A0AAV4QE60_9ARAC|nr:hypothetical protein CDAR_385871 [Caerostris darwini]